MTDLLLREKPRLTLAENLFEDTVEQQQQEQETR